MPLRTKDAETAGLPPKAPAHPLSLAEGAVIPNWEWGSSANVVDALDLALARQEALAAANASNPLARAIILRLAGNLFGGGQNGKGR